MGLDLHGVLMRAELRVRLVEIESLLLQYRN